MWSLTMSIQVDETNLALVRSTIPRLHRILRRIWWHLLSSSLSKKSRCWFDSSFGIIVNTDSPGFSEPLAGGDRVTLDVWISVRLSSLGFELSWPIVRTLELVSLLWIAQHFFLFALSQFGPLQSRKNNVLSHYIALTRIILGLATYSNLYAVVSMLQ